MRIQPHPLPRTHAPRTAAQAFPKSCDYACAVQRFDGASWRRLGRDEWVSLACLVAILIAAPFIFGLLR
jgi:hypothetical protein